MNSNNIIYTPYTYLIGWTELNKWYYGVRYAKSYSCLYETGCHPDDFWETYFTSSNEVKVLVKKHGDPNIRQIRKRFTTSKDAQDWELKVLKKLDLSSDVWINKHICGKIIYSPDVRKRIGRNSKSLTGLKKSKEHRENISKGRMGIVFSEEHKKNIAIKRANQVFSKESQEIKSLKMSKKTWWNNGNRCCRTEECPGEGWVRGRLSFKKPL